MPVSLSPSNRASRAYPVRSGRQAEKNDFSIYIRWLDYIRLPLTWHIALTTVYALTCYTVILDGLMPADCGVGQSASVSK